MRENGEADFESYAESIVQQDTGRETKIKFIQADDKQLIKEESMEASAVI